MREHHSPRRRGGEKKAAAAGPLSHAQNAAPGEETYVVDTHKRCKKERVPPHACVCTYCVCKCGEPPASCVQRRYYLYVSSNNGNNNPDISTLELGGNSSNTFIPHQDQDAATLLGLSLSAKCALCYSTKSNCNSGRAPSSALDGSSRNGSSQQLVQSSLWPGPGNNSCSSSWGSIGEIEMQKMRNQIIFPGRDRVGI